MANRILVTGLSGLIGQALLPSLSSYGSVRSLNRRVVDGVDSVQASILNYDDIRTAFDDVDVVVHLAAKAGERYSWDDLHTTNIQGTFNVLTAAVDAGCRRVIFASSGATVSGYETVEPYKTLVSGIYDNAPPQWNLIDHTWATRPSGKYGTTKVWGEAFSRHIVDTTEMSVFCVRIGYVNRDDRPGRPRDFSIWCSQRDIVSALTKSIEADSSNLLETFFVTSRNKWGYRDLTHAEQVVGFVPQDEAEAYR
ncbi:MAG: NAD(P)-dependent oxidoreductase [Gammaproteobacteria bacterium]|nr:NAD(P)-dependent oxidoreductase [Gammaproteobacteria bacterium]